MAAAITLICLIFIVIVSGITWGLCNDKPECLFLLFLLFLCVPAISDLTRGPTKQDVIEGRAIYIETTHVYKGDTTKTYELKWRPRIVQQ